MFIPFESLLLGCVIQVADLVFFLRHFLLSSFQGSELRLSIAEPLVAACRNFEDHMVGQPQEKDLGLEEYN